MGFYTIQTSTQLSRVERRRARDAGPPAVGSRVDARQLLRSAGFVDIEETDLTDAYRRTQGEFVSLWSEFGDELARALGSDVYEQRMFERRRTKVAIADGLLRRSLLVASRPRRPTAA